jgi:hypothetical protein
MLEFDEVRDHAEINSLIGEAPPSLQITTRFLVET